MYVLKSCKIFRRFFLHTNLNYEGGSAVKRKGISILSTLLLAVSLVLSGCGQTRMMFGTGGTAGTYYAYGGVLAQYITNYSDARVTAVSSGGSKVNIQSIQDGDFQLGFTQSDVCAYAWNGTKSFESDGPTHDFRVLGALYNETVQLFSMDPEIRTVEDLRGKRVSIGEAGSGVYFNALDVLEAAGLTLDDIRPQYQSFDASKEALKDGMIDAAFIVAGAPTPAITELATTNGVSFIPIDGSLQEKLLSEHPYYSTQTIEAGTYPGQTEDINTISVEATIIVSASLPDDLVYDMTAAIFDHIDEISAENAKGAELSVENASSVQAAPFHAGAAKYYKEHGIDVETLDPSEDTL